VESQLGIDYLVSEADAGEGVAEKGDHAAGEAGISNCLDGASALGARPRVADLVDVHIIVAEDAKRGEQNG